MPFPQVADYLKIHSKAVVASVKRHRRLIGSSQCHPLPTALVMGPYGMPTALVTIGLAPWRQETKVHRAIACVLGVLVVGTACSHSSAATAPTSPATTPAVPPPLVVETFSDTLPVGSFKVFSFTIAVNGTVNARLDSVSGAGVPATVQIGVGIGQISGIDCATTTSATIATNGVVTGTFGPGTFCIRVYDVGNLFAP